LPAATVNKNKKELFSRRNGGLKKYDASNKVTDLISSVLCSGASSGFPARVFLALTNKKKI